MYMSAHVHAFFLLSSAVPAPSIVLLHPPLTQAGQSLLINCTASVISNLVVTPFLQWLAPDGSNIGNHSAIEETIITPGRVSTLRFMPLHTSHGGLYSCRAGIHIPGAGLLALTTENTSVIVQSESQVIY